MTRFRSFLTALGFLTRLHPTRPSDRVPDFAAATAWFPAVGLVVGGLMVLAPLGGVFSNWPWCSAWLVLVLDIWLTRGLHLDGLSDLADAWGAMATGERFWNIVKDSRIGAFGVMALVMALSGQLFCLAGLIERGALGVVIWSPVLGRTAAVALMAVCRGLARPGLGGLFLAGATPSVLALCLGQCLIAGLILVSPSTLAWGLGLTGLAVMALARLARREKGLNGDFLGAVIVAGELAALLAGTRALG